MKIRNFLVALGLNTGAKNVKDRLRHPVISISKGSQVSIFNVLELTDEEVLLFIPDKHLDAWLSFIIQGLPGHQEIVISTTVKYHNLIGKIYFNLIQPFHVLIIRSILNRLLIQYSLK
jgi:hypothetical protein